MQQVFLEVSVARDRSDYWSSVVRDEFMGTRTNAPDNDMIYHTKKFGSLDLDADAIIVFPDGLIGFEDQRHWVLLSESDSETVGWLQSVNDPQLAFCVVTPGTFVDDYLLRIHRQQLDALPWSREDRALVIAIVSCQEDRLTMNLKAPVVINMDRCVGCQVVATDEQPIRYPLPVQAAPLRKSA